MWGVQGLVNPSIWLVAGLLASGVPAFGQVDWRGLELPGLKRPVAFFPGPYELAQDTVQTDLGLVPSTTYFSRDDDAASGNRLYTVTVIDFAEGTFPPDSLARREAFFASTVAAAAEAVSGEVLISQPLERGDEVPAWTFRIDYSAGGQPATVRNLAFVRGDRYYHLQVFSLRTDAGTRARERFFESFRPLPAPTNQP